MVSFYIPNISAKYSFKISSDSHDGSNDKQDISASTAVNEYNKRSLYAWTFIATILVLSTFTIAVSSFLTLNPNVNALRQQQQQLQFPKSQQKGI
jgi:hypothetical protein